MSDMRRNFFSDVARLNSVAKQDRRQPAPVSSTTDEACRYREPAPSAILEPALIGFYEWVGTRGARARSASARSEDICKRLPDFICIGVQKAGATRLYEQLLGHPDIFIPKKELDFFFRPLDLFLARRAFRQRRLTQICGDISANYAAFEGLAERIHNVCPGARISHMRRDPVEQALFR
jgi:hypothetical protein